MKIMHLVSCGGWSSDAYWAAQVCRELTRAGHEATLVCRRGTEERVMSRAREEGVQRIETLSLRSGLRPAADVRDVKAVRAVIAGYFALVVAWFIYFYPILSGMVIPSAAWMQRIWLKTWI